MIQNYNVNERKTINFHFNVTEKSLEMVSILLLVVPNYLLTKMWLDSICLKFVIHYHIFLLKLFGLWKSEKFRFIYKIYSIALITITLYILLITELQDYNNHSDPPQIESSVIYTYNPSLFILNAIVLVIIYVTQNVHLSEQHEMYKIGMQLFETINNHINELKLIPWIIKYIIGSFCINILYLVFAINIYVTHQKQLILLHNIKQILPHLIMYCIIATVQNHFYGLILAIWYHHKEINTGIYQIANKAAQITIRNTSIFQNITKFCDLSDELNRIAILHQRLFNLSILCNRLFSFQILVIIAWKSFLFTVQLYLEYILLATVDIRQENNNVETIIENLIMLLLNISGLFTIAYVSSELRTEVSMNYNIGLFNV